MTFFKAFASLRLQNEGHSWPEKYFFICEKVDYCFLPVLLLPQYYENTTTLLSYIKYCIDMVCYYNFAFEKYVWPLIICTFDLMSFQTLEILGILWWHSFDNLFLAQFYFGSWQLPAFFNFILKRKLVSKQLLRVSEVGEPGLLNDGRKGTLFKTWRENEFSQKNPSNKNWNF